MSGTAKPLNAWVSLNMWVSFRSGPIGTTDRPDPPDSSVDPRGQPEALEQRGYQGGVGRVVGQSGPIRAARDEGGHLEDPVVAEGEDVEREGQEHAFRLVP